jgi:ATP-dependent DNA ligase
VAVFIDVMLADKLPKVQDETLTHVQRLRLQLERANLRPEEWVVEEKFDGHRLEMLVGGSDITADLFSEGKPVRSWSRDGKPRILPRHITEAASRLPEGRYDGELLVPGKRSYGVTELTNASDLVYVVFDVLELRGQDLTTPDVKQQHRRALLELLFQKFHSPSPVRLAEQHPFESIEMTVQRAGTVWDRDGEGLIIKKRAGQYRPGKRSKEWLKVKALRHAVLTITGYVSGLSGPYSRVALIDDDGNRTTVKTRNAVERERLARNPTAFIGRKLHVEYQERTPDGSYLHIMWDRFEEE